MWRNVCRSNSASETAATETRQAFPSFCVSRNGNQEHINSSKSEGQEVRLVPRHHGAPIPDVTREPHVSDIAPVAELVTEAEDYVRASDPLMAGMGDGKGEPWVPEKFVGRPGDGQGLRYNDGKPRFDLMPPEALKALAEHYGRGAEKYAARNWERGMDWCKCFASLERHAWAWMGGEDLDPENGSHHMIAVAWNAIALFTYAMRHIGTDDRPKS